MSYKAHQTAVIDDGCKIGNGTNIWHFSHIMPNCIIGNNCNIGQNVVDDLPQPAGYRILVLPFTPREKTKGGILFSQESLDKARIATTCGYVLKMGDLAYKDKNKFNDPWCKKGDWVIFARYAGSRLPIEGGEVRLLNDDEVLGTVKDPESILHLI